MAESSIAGGRLLGLNNLQSHTDTLTRNVDQASKAAADVNKALGTLASLVQKLSSFGASASGQAAKGTAQSIWGSSGGNNNGGNYRHSNAGPSGTPNGGAVSFGGQGKGSSSGGNGGGSGGNGGGAAFGGQKRQGQLGNLVNYFGRVGARYQGEYVTEDWALYNAQLGTGMGQSNARRTMDTFLTGTDRIDRASAANTTLSTGNAFGSTAWRNQMSAVAGATTLNPSISMGDAAQANAAIGSAGGFLYGMATGVNTRPDGKQMDIASFAKAMMQRQGIDGNKKLTEKQINALYEDQASPWLQSIGNMKFLGATGQQMVLDYSKDQAVYVQNGGNASDFDKAYRAAGNDNSAGKAAKKDLEKHGLTKNSISALTRENASSDNKNTEFANSFNDSLQTSAKLLEKFNEVLNKTIDNQVLGGIPGALAGASSVLSNPLSAGKQMGAAGLGMASTALHMYGGYKMFQWLRGGGAASGVPAPTAAGGIGAGHLLGAAAAGGVTYSALNYGQHELSSHLGWDKAANTAGIQGKDWANAATTVGKWTGVGAAAGTAIEPGVGSAVGAGIGAVIGGISAAHSLWSQGHKKTNDGTGGSGKAEKQTDKNAASKKSGRIKFIWPAKGPITMEFHGYKGHDGIDIGVPKGTPVKAGNAGTVIAVNHLTISYGNHIIIDHGNGVTTLYAHLSQTNTSVGRKVKQGEVIGHSGNTGNVRGKNGGYHLHFTVRIDGQAVNPRGYLSGSGGATGTAQGGSEAPDASSGSTGADGSSGSATDATGAATGSSSSGGSWSGSYGSVSEADNIASALAGGGSVASSGSASTDGTGSDSGSSGTSTSGADSSSSAGTGASGAAYSGKGGVLPAKTMRSVLSAAGFKGGALEMALAISMAESRFNPKAHNTNAKTGDNSYGLFQINMLGSMGPARRKQYHLKSNDDLLNPETNAHVAYLMSGGGKSWSPWSTYKSGAYKNYLNKYDKGAWKLDRDETAVVHKDEMIIPAKQADTIRDTLLRENGSKSPAGTSKPGVTINFGKGSVVFQVNGGTVTEETGRAAARGFVAALKDNRRIENLGKGL